MKKGRVSRKLKKKTVTYIHAGLLESKNVFMVVNIIKLFRKGGLNRFRTSFVDIVDTVVFS